MMKLTKNNYYSQKANKEYMSYSQFKDFCKCPAYAMAKIKGEWQDEETDSLLVGSYVDAWLDGTLDKFKEEHPEIFTLKGELKAQYKKAEELCEVIKKDEFLYKLLKGKRQKIFTCTIAGVPFKVKIDSLHDVCIVDGKVLKDCEDAWIDGEKKPFIYINRYDLQGAIYKTAVKQNLMKDLPFMLAVVTKEKTPDKRVFRLSNQVIEDAMQEIILKAPVFDAIKKGKEEIYRCNRCDYCRSTKALNENSVEVL